MSNQQKI